MSLKIAASCALTNRDHTDLPYAVKLTSNWLHQVLSLDDDDGPLSPDHNSTNLGC